MAALVLVGLRLRAMPAHLPSELALSPSSHTRGLPDTHHEQAGRGARIPRWRFLGAWSPGFSRGPVPDGTGAAAIFPPARRASHCRCAAPTRAGATFGGDGTYENSYTFFEVGILPRLPSATASGGPVAAP